ncbi:MAG: hypothetical protein NUV34_06180 [Sulfuricaulis sp.]|nr:hypothetical protein [Sulfuricaulis sp.]
MAYSTLNLQTSIIAALGDLYQPSNSGKIEATELRTQQSNGEVKTHTMGEIAYNDIAIFADEMEIALRMMNPFIQSLFAKNAKALVQLMRGVTEVTKSGFKGTMGSGNQLDAVMLRAEQFGNPDLANSATVRTSWVRAIAAAATQQFIIAQDALGANAHAALAASSVQATGEGIAILGFVNPAASPCTSAFDVQTVGVNHNIQNLAFENVNAEYGDAIIELKQPVLIWPGETALINVRYYRNGSDELTPIGLWFKTAANLRALATS